MAITMTAALVESVDPLQVVEAKPDASRKPRRKRSATLLEGDRVGAWRVERELGRGGMGSVYAVVHNGFGKRAALKLCHRSILGPTFTMETFLREARIVHLIDHPGIVDVFATGTYDKRPYLAMERLTGQTLGERLADGPLPKHEAIDILLEICDVLAAAHRAGVVHRDLKVDNVFLLDALGAGGRRVKLLDWGVARIMGEDDPMKGMIAGTLTYVAPEQIRSDELTPAADLYSLGVLAYKVLLGAVPFAAERDLDLVRMHLHACPPPPEARWLDIPAPLARLLLGLLAKQPAARPSLAEVVATLTEARKLVAPRVRRSLLQRLATVPPLPTSDVLGRPGPLALPVPGAQGRVMGAIVGVAALAASAATWLVG